MIQKNSRRIKPKYTPTEARLRVEEFAAVAQEYCEMIERVNRTPKKKFVLRALEVIPRLLAQAPRLPDTKEDWVTPAKIEKGYYPEIEKKLGRHKYYLGVFNPYDRQEQTADKYCVTVDLGDSYCDLKRVLNHYQADPKRRWRVAAYQWKWSYHWHYGYHLVAALNCLHWMASDSRYFK